MFRLLRKSLVVLCLLSLFASSAMAAARQRDTWSPRERGGAIARFLARILGDGSSSRYRSAQPT
jgi:hypothetical protein